MQTVFNVVLQYHSGGLNRETSTDNMLDDMTYATSNMQSVMRWLMTCVEVIWLIKSIHTSQQPSRHCRGGITFTVWRWKSLFNTHF